MNSWAASQNTTDILVQGLLSKLVCGLDISVKTLFFYKTNSVINTTHQDFVLTADLWEDKISTVISAQWFNVTRIQRFPPPGWWTPKSHGKVTFLVAQPRIHKQNNSVVQEQAQWAWLELWTVITWKKKDTSKISNQSTSVKEPSLCFSSKNDHGISMNIPR